VAREAKSEQQVMEQESFAMRKFGEISRKPHALKLDWAQPPVTGSWDGKDVGVTKKWSPTAFSKKSNRLPPKILPLVAWDCQRGWHRVSRQGNPTIQ